MLLICSLNWQNRVTDVSANRKKYCKATRCFVVKVCIVSISKSFLSNWRPSGGSSEEEALSGKNFGAPIKGGSSRRNK